MSQGLLISYVPNSDSYQSTRFRRNVQAKLESCSLFSWGVIPNIYDYRDGADKKFLRRGNTHQVPAIIILYLPSAVL